MPKAICEDCGSLVDAELTHNGVCPVWHYVHCGWGHQLSPEDLIPDDLIPAGVTDHIKAQAAEIERLRGDLAKAQGALHQIAGKKDYADDPWDIARTTLAELTVSATVKDYLTTEDEKQSHEWKCPIDYPGCRKHCGSPYGCKN